jgi:hypothetical protein
MALLAALSGGHQGKGTPVDNRGGWHFPSKLPPLNAEAPPKGQATRTNICAGRQA